MFEIEKMEQEFDYSLVDNETADFLRSCEYEMNGIAEDARVKFGGVLKKAQERLAKDGYGCFLEWVKSGGISKDDAYYYIELNRLSLNLERQKTENFLNAPKSLQKEVMKKNAPEDMKQKVYEGDITTHKEYKDMMKERDEAEQRARQAEQQAEQAKKQAESERKERERLEEENENIEPEIKEIYIEDEERINNLTKEIEKINDQKEQMEKRLKSSENDAEKYRKLQDDIDKLRNEKEDVIRQIDNVSSIGKFISRVERSFEEDLAPVKYSRAIEELERSEVAQESLETIVSKVEKWCNEMRTIMKNNNITEVIEHE